MMWLDSLKYHKKCFQRRHCFVVMNNELESDFDKFKAEIKGKYYMEGNDLLYYWMKEAEIGRNSH